MRLKLVALGGLLFALGCSCGGPNPDDIWWDSGWTRPDTGWWWDSPTETAETGEPVDTEGEPDADGDGFPASVDCDDADPGVNPGARDTPEDGVDQDCSGEDALAWEAMDAGGDSVCAVRQGLIRCWPEGVHEGAWTDVWVSSDGLALCAEGDGFSCWGEDLLGLVSQAPAATPDQVDLGAWHGCGLSQGALECWGSDLHGQRLPEGDYARFASGAHTVCAATAATGELVCAGADFAGQAQPPQGVAADGLDMGGEQGCAIVDERSRVLCWGATVGEPPVFELSLLQVAVSDRFACALVEDGSVSCWGDSPGQAPVGPWVELAVTEEFACALAADGLLQCWGP